MHSAYRFLTVLALLSTILCSILFSMEKPLEKSAFLNYYNMVRKECSLPEFYSYEDIDWHWVTKVQKKLLKNLIYFSTMSSLSSFEYDVLSAYNQLRQFCLLSTAQSYININWKWVAEKDKEFKVSQENEVLEIYNALRTNLPRFKSYEYIDWHWVTTEEKKRLEMLISAENDQSLFLTMYNQLRRPNLQPSAKSYKHIDWHWIKEKGKQLHIEINEPQQKEYCGLQ